MKTASLYASLILATMLIGPVSQPRVRAETVTAPSDAKIVGVWRAEMDGFPFVTVTLRDESGHLSGAVLFYLHRRDPGQAMTSTPGVPEPLLNASFDGKTLVFKVSHQSAHQTATESETPVSFQLKFTGPDKAKLIREEDSYSIELTRTDSSR